MTVAELSSVLCITEMAPFRCRPPNQHVGDRSRRAVFAVPLLAPLAVLLLVDAVFVPDEQVVLLEEEGLLCVMAGTVMVRWGIGRNWDGMRGVNWYVLLLPPPPPDVSKLRGDAETSNVGVLEWDWCCCVDCCWRWY